MLRVRGSHPTGTGTRTLAVAVAVGLSAGGWTWAADRVPPCERLQARLRVANSDLPKGGQPDFTLTLRNVTESAVRLLDTRGGRRRDLGDSYYKLVVRTLKGREPNILTAISDPGPISDEDWFVLGAGQEVIVPVTTPLALDTLQKGGYRAHVVITLDPYVSGSRCRSDYAEFRVR